MKKARRARLVADAEAHGWQYRSASGAVGLPGSVFRTASKARVTDVVDALAAPAPLVAGDLIGLYGEGSSTPRNVPTAFLGIPLRRTVPHVLLFGRGLGAFRLTGVSPAGRQRYSLEGDFDRTFTLYCPAGYERDALQIFTPDLMALLVDVFGGSDVELVDDWMFVYQRGHRALSDGWLPRVATVAEATRAKLDRQTSGYRDERSERPSEERRISPSEHAARAGRVAASGSRLRTRPGLLSVLGTVGGVVFLGVALLTFLAPELLPWLR